MPGALTYGSAAGLRLRESVWVAGGAALATMDAAGTLHVMDAAGRFRRPCLRHPSVLHAAPPPELQFAFLPYDRWASDSLDAKVRP